MGINHMKIQSVVLRADGQHCVVLEDGSTLERIVSLEASASADEAGMVRVKLEVLMPPEPSYRATDAEREIDSLNLD